MPKLEKLGKDAKDLIATGYWTVYKVSPNSDIYAIKTGEGVLFVDGRGEKIDPKIPTKDQSSWQYCPSEAGRALQKAVANGW